MAEQQSQLKFTLEQFERAMLAIPPHYWQAANKLGWSLDDGLKYARQQIIKDVLSLMRQQGGTCDCGRHIKID